MRPEHVEVLIVGAGLSGIGAAHHLQTAFPGKSYGSRAPWRLGMSYAHDVLTLRYGKINDGAMRSSGRAVR